jgi:O-phosphoseryl-tRNA(Sec) selenium transferase, SepSecS
MLDVTVGDVLWPVLQAKLCKRHGVAHIVNNAYGVQSAALCQLITAACRKGRVDAIVQSTDKNFMVRGLSRKQACACAHKTPHTFGRHTSLCAWLVAGACWRGDCGSTAQQHAPGGGCQPGVPGPCVSIAKPRPVYDTSALGRLRYGTACSACMPLLHTFAARSRALYSAHHQAPLCRLAGGFAAAGGPLPGAAVQAAGVCRT